MSELPPRRAAQARTTKETSIAVEVDLDSTAISEISTGLPFFDHMLSQICRHGELSMKLEAHGDIDVDAHHLVEDVGLTLGGAINEALLDRRGIERFANVAIPMDEVLVNVALDISGRPFLSYHAALTHPHLLGNPGFDPQLAEEFFRALSLELRCALHIDVIRGVNTHHIIEATHKGFGRALRGAKARSGYEIPSTKGVL